MASSGNFTTTNRYIVFWVEVTQNSQNIGSNTSNVTVKVWIKRTNSGYTTYGSGTVYTNIDGVQRNVSITPSQTITSTPRAIFHQDLTISHNSDGTKVLSVQVGIAHESFNSSNPSNAYNVSLTTIPRASSFTLSNSDVLAGSNITGTISRASGNFTHDVYLGFGTKQWTLATGVGTSFNVTIPMETLNEIPNAIKGQGNIRVVTKNGNSEVGQKAVNFYISAGSNIVPIYSSLNISRVDNTVPSNWGVYVKGKSKAKLTINGASGTYGSTITKYSISGDGYSTTSNSFTTGTLNTAGTVTFTGVVTDSRGRTATKTVTCSVVDYSSPSISEFTISRCTSSGTASDEGTYVKIKPVYSYSSVGGKNTFSARVEYKLNSASSWTSGGAITTSGKEVIIGGGKISPDSSYDIRLIIQDAFETVTRTVSIPTASTTLDFRQGGKGMAIGKVAERDGLEVAWDSIFKKTLKVEGNCSFNKLKLLSDPNGNTGFGYDAKTTDAYISNTSNNWLRLKSNKTMTYAGYKVYTAFEKPTASEIGALSLTGGTLTGDLVINNNKRLKVIGANTNLEIGAGGNDVFLHNTASGSYLQFNNNGNLYINSLLIGTHAYPIIGRDTSRWFSRMAPVMSDGVIEVGKYIDFHKASSDSADYTVRLDANGSALWCSTSIQQGSDRGLKENIKYLDDEPILLSTIDNSSTPFKDFIRDFKFATYNYKGSEGRCFGFIAQDISQNPVGKLMLQKHEMDIINKETNSVEGTETTLAFNLADYTSVVAKALQEEIREKDQKILELENRISDIEKIIEAYINV